MKEINYAKLAIAIIEEFESDREETGRKEIEKGMRYIVNKYTTPHDMEVVDDVFITITGYSLSSLIKKAERIPDDDVIL